MLKSRGAGTLLPLMTSATLTMELSVTAEEGGVRAGRPFPLPLSDDESSERTQRQHEEDNNQADWTMNELTDDHMTQDFNSQPNS